MNMQEDKDTALLIATERSDYCHEVSVFIEQGADVNAKNNSGITALHMAAKRGDSDTVRVLIKQR
jgi:ankyrin repeat protein